MSNHQSSELPKLSELVVILADLSTSFEHHLERAIAIGIPNITFQDHLVIAALRRAMDNVRGMIAMVDQQNLFCGMPIVRFQIDTAMTLYGRRLVDDVDAYVTHMMVGKERRDYPDSSGKRMSDNYLHKRLTDEHEYASALYSESSAFIHFSVHHLHRVMDLDHWKQTGELKFLSHEAIVAGWSNEQKRSGLTVFVYASRIILHECELWENDRWPST